ncbi:TRIM2_3 [Mytilus edulis]|uniref:TRIM2_3 n=1 Tax=Mytilus edulis TaxID=6550 RepID=A0A8S3S7E4_MYTED|nr:TRIM2_3 [Mytilus edulis]
MICLMDGRFVIVDPLGEVNLLTSDVKISKHLSIHGDPCCVTQTNQNTIVISYPYQKAIKTFDLENETLSKVITLDKQCWGLSFSNNSLAVGFGGYDDDDKEIRIIDLEGNTQKVIYSDYNGKAVYCYDESGKQIWQYTQDLSGPVGLCTDTYGNIIVADYESNRIIVISKDGQNSKVLIDEEDELENPICISLNIISHQVLFVITMAHIWQNSIYHQDKIHTGVSTDITFL